MKSSREKIQAIKADIAETRGRQQGKIAKTHGVSRSLVSDIATERVHGDIPWPAGYTPVPKRAGGQRRQAAEHDATDRRVLELESDIIHLNDELRVERAKAKAGSKKIGRAHV